MPARGRWWALTAVSLATLMTYLDNKVSPANVSKNIDNLRYLQVEDMKEPPVRT
jgi:hypothetical protein